MLNITFHESDRQLANTISRDLQALPFTLSNQYLIVIAGDPALKDGAVHEAVFDAREANKTVIVLQMTQTALPVDWQDVIVVDAKSGYRARRLTAVIRQLEVGEQRISRNNQYLFVGLVVTGIVFAAAIIGVASGTVVFPQEEYATENAANLNMIETFAAPTIEYLLPRSTEDAMQFEATFDAAPTRVRVYLALTATAMPADMQATQEAFSTRVFLTEEALTATPE